MQGKCVSISIWLIKISLVHHRHAAVFVAFFDLFIRVLVKVKACLAGYTFRNHRSRNILPSLNEHFRRCVSERRATTFVNVHFIVGSFKLHDGSSNFTLTTCNLDDEARWRADAEKEKGEGAREIEGEKERRGIEPARSPDETKVEQTVTRTKILQSVIYGWDWFNWRDSSKRESDAISQSGGRRCEFDACSLSVYSRGNDFVSDSSLG